jgi:hypothetical protein
MVMDLAMELVYGNRYSNGYGWATYYQVTRAQRHVRAGYVNNEYGDGWVHSKAMERERFLAKGNICSGTSTSILVV